MRDLDLLIDRTLRSSKWMEAHLMEPIYVSNMAYEAGYSLHHFIRIFRQVTGRRPIEFLQKRRLTKASRMLLESSKAVQDISKMAGYDSPSSFGRAFRKQYGINPLTYREEQKHLWFHDVEPLEEERLWHQLSGGIKLLDENLILNDLHFQGFHSIQGYYSKDRLAPLQTFQAEQEQIDALWELRWNDKDLLIQGKYNHVYGVQVEDCDGPQCFKTGGRYVLFRHRGEGDKQFFHSCNFIYQRWMEAQGLSEDSSRPVLIKHREGESTWLHCQAVDIYIPICE